MNRRFWAATLCVLATALAACSPGYMKASELESKHQGPSDCEARCVELGMRMGAFVLVSDTLPGCVCQPKPSPSEPPKPAASEPAKPAASDTPDTPKSSPSEAPKPDAAQPGASLPTTSDTAVMAAAVAVRVSQTERQKKEQQSYIPK
jgi:hypothetical protein